MDEAARITRLGLEEAAAIQSRAVSGDPAAAREFLLYSAWKRIEADRRFSLKRRVEALRELAARVRTVEFARPGDPDYADAPKPSRDGAQPGAGAAFSPPADLPPLPPPWWGDEPDSEVPS